MDASSCLERCSKRLEGLKVQVNEGEEDSWAELSSPFGHKESWIQMACQLATYREQLELHVLVSFR